MRENHQRFLLLVVGLALVITSDVVQGEVGPKKGEGKLQQAANSKQAEPPVTTTTAHAKPKSPPNNPYTEILFFETFDSMPPAGEVFTRWHKTQNAKYTGT